MNAGLMREVELRVIKPEGKGSRDHQRLRQIVEQIRHWTSIGPAPLASVSDDDVRLPFGLYPQRLRPPNLDSDHRIQPIRFSA